MNSSKDAWGVKSVMEGKTDGKASRDQYVSYFFKVGGVVINKFKSEEF